MKRSIEKIRNREQKETIDQEKHRKKERQREKNIDEKEISKKKVRK